jgi:hypothetical protein
MHHHPHKPSTADRRALGEFSGLRLDFDALPRGNPRYRLDHLKTASSQ